MARFPRLTAKCRREGHARDVRQVGEHMAMPFVHTTALQAVVVCEGELLRVEPVLVDGDGTKVIFYTESNSKTRKFREAAYLIISTMLRFAAAFAVRISCITASPNPSKCTSAPA